jgi:hypothetical protein
MALKERDEHLESVLGIREKEKEEKLPTVVPTSSVPVTVTEDSEREGQLIRQRDRLDAVVGTLESVLESHADVSKEFSKSRDVEALAALAKSMVEVAKEIRETNMQIYGEKKTVTPINNNTQNNVIVTSMRELLDIIEEKERDQ